MDLAEPPASVTFVSGYGLQMAEKQGGGGLAGVLGNAD